MQNKKVVDYRIIPVSIGKDEMDDEVAGLLQSGFQPWGSPCSPEGTDRVFPLQAFVKYEDD